MSSLHDALPEVQLNQPESNWIHTTSVEGPFGITAAVNSFDEVIDWQEHTRSLTQGYYRLIPPPRLQKLQARLEKRYPGFTAVLFTSGPLAERETRDANSLYAHPMAVASHVQLPKTLTAATFHVLHLNEAGLPLGITLCPTPETAAKLHERNRRRGGSLSARAVAHWMQEQDAEPFDPADALRCRELLLEWENASTALFYPSGMAAVTAVLESVLTPQTPKMIVLGNVYRDTHLLLEEMPWAGRNVDTLFLDTHDLASLRAQITSPEVGGVFVETITNPRIEIPDLPAIAQICQEYDKPLFVDNTMATPWNANPLALGATGVIHSTSKYLSGHNGHGGGVVLTRDAGWADRWSTAQRANGLEMSPAEFTSLRQGLETFPERMQRFNTNGQALAERLRSHPAIAQVDDGGSTRPDWLKGLGSVISCEMKSPSLQKLAAFMNHPLPGVIKAPSLGSDKTLFCPYVLLAYYDKSDAYLQECNLSKTLLRFAAGSEETFDPVLDSISEALDVASRAAPTTGTPHG